ncbi:hypothetical protein GP5015_958 [gamma proteobacterium HTCC5015]|nr:hypothetical protein GP5015_958 [gamma proteobacterium HTCC5015]
MKQADNVKQFRRKSKGLLGFHRKMIAPAAKYRDPNNGPRTQSVLIATLNRGE